MALRQVYRLNPPTLEADRQTLQVLQELSDYTPMKSEYATLSLQGLEGQLAAAQLAESRARRLLEQARAEVIDAAWAFHHAIRGAKAQVVAQYGEDAPVIQAIGLTRRSERKRPRSRPASAQPRDE